MRSRTRRAFEWFREMDGGEKLGAGITRQPALLHKALLHYDFACTEFRN